MKIEVLASNKKSRTVIIEKEHVVLLLEAARHAATKHYSILEKPFPVGAALIMADDEQQRVFASSNSEMSVLNAGICAERAAIHYAVGQGFRRIRYLALSLPLNLEKDLSGRSPCGLCRQTIAEFSDDQTLILLDRGLQDGENMFDVVDIEAILPYGYRFSQK